MNLLRRFQLIRFLSWDAKRPSLRSHAEAWERCDDAWERCPFYPFKRVIVISSQMLSAAKCAGHPHELPGLCSCPGNFKKNF